MAVLRGLPPARRPRGCYVGPGAVAGGGHDLEAIRAAITPHTRLILVCNPNNPTGTVVAGSSSPRSSTRCRRLPRGARRGLPGAHPRRGRAGRDRRIRDRPNVAVLRTFSKAYGLAGLRVGFLIGHPPVAAAVRKTMLTFTVSSIAQAAAVASLAAEAELLERVETVVKERDRVRSALLADGWAVPATEANFVWLRLGEHTTAFAEACETRDRRPPVRRRGCPGLDRNPRSQRRLPRRRARLPPPRVGPGSRRTAATRKRG